MWHNFSENCDITLLGPTKYLFNVCIKNLLTICQLSQENDVHMFTFVDRHKKTICTSSNHDN